LDTYVKELERDAVELAKFKNLLTACYEFANDLRYSVQEIHSEAVRLVGERNSMGNPELPPEVAQIAANSKAGIDLIVKMLSRLQDRVPKIQAGVIPLASEFILLDNSPVPADPVEQKSFLEEIAKHNYQLLTNIRRAAEDAREAIFSFVKTHVLAVMDGVVDGRRHFEQQKRDLIKTYPEDAEAVENWFSVYDDLSGLLNTLLVDFQMEVILPAQGEKVQYDLHEPFDTVRDDQFSDESVHEVIRPGYRYLGHLYGELGYVIRPALVVVTKNV
jgi:molecular chaperone GrpE (heat shock protein)